MPKESEFCKTPLARSLTGFAVKLFRLCAILRGHFILLRKTIKLMGCWRHFPTLWVCVPYPPVTQLLDAKTHLPQRLWTQAADHSLSAKIPLPRPTCDAHPPLLTYHTLARPSCRAVPVPPDSRSLRPAALLPSRWESESRPGSTATPASSHRFTQAAVH